MTTPGAEGVVPKCPECATDLTPIRQRRSGRQALWCWKCERYLRPGEQRAARREIEVTTTCPVCEGEGIMGPEVGDVCRSCGGSGHA